MTETRKIELTLEESGVLCYLLKDAILEAKNNRTVNQSWLGPSLMPFIERMDVLHQKIAAINDEMMGRKT